MSATKPIVHIPPPEDLVTGPPLSGTGELTEQRILTLSFPNNERERRCFQYLLHQMEAMSEHPSKTKTEYSKLCRQKFRVTVGSFESCWREAIKATGVQWDRPGRRPR